MLAINGTLIYHALTYNVDGSRTSQDKTNRCNWRWQPVSCRRAVPLVYAGRYFAQGTNKTWLINKCINIAAGRQFVSRLPISRRSSPRPFFRADKQSDRFLGRALEKYSDSRKNRNGTVVPRNDSGDRFFNGDYGYVPLKREFTGSLIRTIRSPRTNGRGGGD